jgi:hypothetical protein
MTEQYAERSVDNKTSNALGNGKTNYYAASVQHKNAGRYMVHDILRDFYVLQASS